MILTTINEYKQKMINEEIETLIKFKCLIIYDRNVLTQEELSSKVRSIRGITIVTNIDIDDEMEYEHYKAKMNIKVDYSMFPKFSVKKLKKEFNNIFGLKSISLKEGEFENNNN